MYIIKISYRYTDIIRVILNNCNKTYIKMLNCYMKSRIKNLAIRKFASGRFIAPLSHLMCTKRCPLHLSFFNVIDKNELN